MIYLYNILIIKTHFYVVICNFRNNNNNYNNKYKIKAGKRVIRK